VIGIVINVCCIVSYERKMRVANTNTGLSLLQIGVRQASVVSTDGKIDSNNVNTKPLIECCHRQFADISAILLTPNEMSNTHKMVVDTLLAVEIFITKKLFVVACQSNSGVLYYKCSARVVI